MINVISEDFLTPRLYMQVLSWRNGKAVTGSLMFNLLCFQRGLAKVFLHLKETEGIFVVFT